MKEPGITGGKKGHPPSPRDSASGKQTLEAWEGGGHIMGGRGRRETPKMIRASPLHLQWGDQRPRVCLSLQWGSTIQLLVERFSYLLTGYEQKAQHLLAVLGFEQPG